MLCWQINVNRVILLGLIAGVTFSVFLIQLVIFMLGSNDNTVSYLMDCASVGSFLIPFAMAVYASTAFSGFTSIGSKQQRGKFLMIPATNLEKYLAVMVYVVVICGLCTIVGYIMGDCLRMLWFRVWGLVSSDPKVSAGMLFNYNSVDHTYYLWSSTVDFLFGKMIPRLVTVWSCFLYWSWFEWANLIVGVLFTIWTHSFFTLGGTLLRRYAFVVTGVLYIAIILLFMGSLYHFGLQVFVNEWNGEAYVTSKVGPMAYVLMVVLPLFSVLNYWLSFRIFKGFQLITNKWTNYDILKR
jgi:hypothetical protein